LPRFLYEYRGKCPGCPGGVGAYEHCHISNTVTQSLKSLGKLIIGKLTMAKNHYTTKLAAHIHKTVAEQADRNGPFTLVLGTVIEGLNGCSEALTVGLAV